MDLAAAGRHYALQKSFKNSIKCLLTVCSREVVKDAFPSFTDEERERLYRMLTNVMTSMHANIEEEFDGVCQELQVAAALDKLDDFAEEHNLDKLYSDKTSIDTIEEEVSRMKKNEIEYLTDSLKKRDTRYRLHEQPKVLNDTVARVEESNNAMKARIELLKKGEGSTAARDLINKVIQWNSECMNNSDI